MKSSLSSSCQILVIRPSIKKKVEKKNHYFTFCREFNDLVPDKETIHKIARVHLPDNSGDPHESQGRETDFALIETVDDVDNCVEPEQRRECWPITSVRLTGPNFQNIRNLEEVRTLGRQLTSGSSFIFFCEQDGVQQKNHLEMNNQSSWPS